MDKTINQIRKEAEEIASGWNGKDEEFVVGGMVYGEDDAGLAQEVVEKCDELLDLVRELEANAKTFF